MLANVGREGQSVSTYVLKMKAYLDQMERLGYPMPLVLGVNMILTSLSKDYDQFVQNYNIHGMGKTIHELHAMLKLAEKGIPKKTPAVLAIRQDWTLEEEPSSIFNRVKEEQSQCIWHIRYLHYRIGLRGYQKLNKGALDLYVDNGNTTAVEAIGSFDLILPSGMILIDMHNHISNERSIYTCSNKKTKHNLDSTFLWHSRLGHINEKYIEKLQHDGLLKSIDDESFNVCVSCISGKMERKPFTHASERADDLLGIIHSDVCGPFRTMSREESAARILNMVPTKKVYKELHMKLWAWENPNSVLLGSLGFALHSPSHRVTVTWHQKLGHMSEQGMKILVGKKSTSWPHITPFLSLRGAKYFVSFIDDYSRGCWVYPIKKKSDVFEVFKVYKAQIKLDSGKKNKCCGYGIMEVDTLVDEFDTFYKEEGIKGSVTRHTLLYKMEWIEMIDRKTFKFEDTWKIWTGKLINYSDLNIFESPVYMMYNTQETTKLDLKSRKCLFLGYADGVKGYRLWDPTTHKVVVSRDVVFIEDKIQENEEGDSTIRETTSIQMEKEFQSNDSFEAAPQHEVNETNESQVPATCTLNHERKRPRWHSDYVMESSVAYCLLIEEGELSTLQEALNNPDAPNGDDQVERYRARLVVKGYAQKEGIDFNEIFSPVAPRCWYKRFDSFIIGLGYNRLHADPCAYFKRFGNNDFVILLLYVDDMLVAGPNKDRISKLKAQLAREFEMKDLGPANKILGMQIHRDRVSRKIWLSQKSYVKKILQRFNMQDCKPISTPFATNIKLSSKMSPSSEKERMEMSRVPYASAVGSLMFAMICTRPDIVHAVGVVSQYMAEPGDLDGSKSTTRYVFTLSGGTVSWVSKLQSVVTMSTTEAEYVAAAQASKEAVWLKMLLDELSHEQEKITLFCDNQSALYLARNPTFHSKTKQIRVQYHFVREKVKEETVDMQKIDTDDNVTDYMTKSINCDKFI
ncbi:retrovirus-related pol polyprotein from transposon TNT 1-94 [Tanacetum coccineum]|uniref:Retrovirus-related pol polyprotein from transposon TNT 1-94 n=1 Tax=Tanacetum coccineum TaxID=301880 RepID=A0ABQ5H5I1_9ASTR